MVTSLRNMVLGVLCIFGYVVIASCQSVALNIWLHNTNVFLVVGLSFSIVTSLFLMISLIWQRPSLHLIWQSKELIVGLNIFSLFNWLLYFLAVKYLEPAVAVTLTQGLGPASMTFYYLYKRQPITRTTAICHSFIVIIATALCVYSLTIRAKFSNYSLMELAFGFLCALLCSLSITSTIIVLKRLANKSIATSSILASRFPLLIVVCLSALLPYDHIDISVDIVAMILAIALIGVAMSVYLMQKGVEFAPPIVVSTSLGLSPFVVFSLQLFHPNAPFSPVILCLIGLIVVFSMVSIFAEAKVAQKV